MKNRWVLAAIVGQTVVTLVAIGYGVSAHSSWEAERQHRLDGERAAVAEMAAAMKAASERLDKVEQELRRCRARASRLTRPAALAPVPPVAEPVDPGTPVAVGGEASFRLLTDPIAWARGPRVAPGPVRPEVAVRAARVAPASLAWR